MAIYNQNVNREYGWEALGRVLELVAGVTVAAKSKSSTGKIIGGGLAIDSIVNLFELAIDYNKEQSDNNVY